MGMGTPSWGPSKQEKEAEEKAEMEARLQSGTDRFNEMMANLSQNPVLGRTQTGMSGFDNFQAMQAARTNATPYSNRQLDAMNKNRGLAGMINRLHDKSKIFGNDASQEPGYDRFQAAIGANPLILQQLQMGQRQMGPQFNAFGFGAQPGLAAQGGSMLANMSSQGMNQLAAGQQNNPTIFKAKS